MRDSRLGLGFIIGLGLGLGCLTYIIGLYAGCKYWASDVQPRESGSSVGRGETPKIYGWCAKGVTRSGEVGGKDGEGAGA